MKHFLIVVDMQKDFVDGALGTAEAQAIVGNVMDKILNFDGQIFATLDTHTENYLQSAEGKKLPVAHCIKGTAGWTLLWRTCARENPGTFPGICKTSTRTPTPPSPRF